MRRLGLTLFTFFVGWTRALLVNRTIDDKFGDSVTGQVPQYIPDGVWDQGDECAGCHAQPDRTQVHNGTWHDATYDSQDPSFSTPQSARFEFTGKQSASATI